MKKLKKKGNLEDLYNSHNQHTMQVINTIEKRVADMKMSEELREQFRLLLEEEKEKLRHFEKVASELSVLMEMDKKGRPRKEKKTKPMDAKDIFQESMEDEMRSMAAEDLHSLKAYKFQVKQEKTEAKIAKEAEKEAKAEAKRVKEAEKEAKAEAKRVKEAEKVKKLEEQIKKLQERSTSPKRTGSPKKAKESNSEEPKSEFEELFGAKEEEFMEAPVTENSVDEEIEENTEIESKEVVENTEIESKDSKKDKDKKDKKDKESKDSKDSKKDKESKEVKKDKESKEVKKDKKDKKDKDSKKDKESKESKDSKKDKKDKDSKKEEIKDSKDSKEAKDSKKDSKKESKKDSKKDEIKDRFTHGETTYILRNNYIFSETQLLGKLKEGEPDFYGSRLSTDDENFTAVKIEFTAVNIQTDISTQIADKACIIDLNCNLYDDDFDKFGAYNPATHTITMVNDEVDYDSYDEEE